MDIGPKDHDNLLRSKQIFIKTALQILLCLITAHLIIVNYYVLAYVEQERSSPT